jgi:hypothetical protein
VVDLRTGCRTLTLHWYYGVEPNTQPARSAGTVTHPKGRKDTMSTDRSTLNAALRQQLRKASEQSQKQPAWTKRQMPAITASSAKANSKPKQA